MTELSEIVAATEAARQQGQPALLATVVRVTGSSYRQAGARMLLTPGGWQAGCISGGCLESDIIRKAWWRTESGDAVVVTYDSTVEEDGSFDDALSWGLGLGCSGIVEVLLERLQHDDSACPVTFIAECLRRRRSGIIATVIASPDAAQIGQRLMRHEGDREAAACTVTDAGLAAQMDEAARESFLTEHPAQTIRLGGADVLLEPILPPTSLLICGANHDAAPLAALAKAVGWQVTVVDPWAGSQPRPERFPGAYRVICCAPRDLPARITVEDRAFAVVMSHNMAHDAAFLAALLPLPLRYLGVLGPRRRTERLLHELGHAADDSRLHGPMGLDIGANDPQTIALSILAEMQAVKADRSGGFLRERPRPIHDAIAAPSGTRRITATPLKAESAV